MYLAVTQEFRKFRDGSKTTFVTKTKYRTEFRLIADRERSRRLGAHDFFMNKKQYKVSNEFVGRLLEEWGLLPWLSNVAVCERIIQEKF